MENSHLTCLRQLEHLTVEVKTFGILNVDLWRVTVFAQVAASEQVYSFKPWEDLSLVFVELM